MIFQPSLIRALSAFKARGVDMVLFGGDITDLSKSKAYDLYNAAYDKVFGDDRPIVQTIIIISAINISGKILLNTLIFPKRSAMSAN